MNTPKTAVIPAAGKGTRFLPSTKATPKEMHPLLNIPLIHKCCVELQEAGVERIIIVTHKDKKTLKKYFGEHTDLKNLLSQDGKTELVKSLESIESFPKVEFAYQEEQLGLAHAIYSAKDEIGNDDFFILLPDEIFIYEKQEQNPCVELLESFKKTSKSCISLLEVPKESVSSYGVAEIEKTSSGIKVLGLVEKPPTEKAPSNFILPGRYLLSNEILKIISETPESPNGEVYLTDSLISLSKSDDLYGVPVKSQRFDGGSVLGFLKANILMGLRDPEFEKELRSFISSI